MSDAAEEYLIGFTKALKLIKHALQASVSSLLKCQDLEVLWEAIYILPACNTLECLPNNQTGVYLAKVTCECILGLMQLLCKLLAARKRAKEWMTLPLDQIDF